VLPAVAAAPAVSAVGVATVAALGVTPGVIMGVDEATGGILYSSE